MIAMSYDDTTEFVLTADQALPPAEQTVFLLRPLSERAQRRIENLFGQAMSMSTTNPESVAEIRAAVPFGDLHALCLCAGIAGWRNLKDTKGRPVEYHADKSGEMLTDLLRCFTVPQKAELAQRILSLNGMTERDVKNSR